MTADHEPTHFHVIRCSCGQEFRDSTLRGPASAQWEDHRQAHAAGELLRAWRPHDR